MTPLDGTGNGPVFVSKAQCRTKTCCRARHNTCCLGRNMGQCINGQLYLYLVIHLTFNTWHNGCSSPNRGNCSASFNSKPQVTAGRKAYGAHGAGRVSEGVLT